MVYTTSNFDLLQTMAWPPVDMEYSFDLSPIEKKPKQLTVKELNAKNLCEK